MKSLAIAAIGTGGHGLKSGSRTSEQISKLTRNHPRLAGLNLVLSNDLDHDDYVATIWYGEKLTVSSGGAYHEGVVDFMSHTDTAPGFEIATTLLVALLPNLRTVAVSKSPATNEVTYCPNLVKDIIRRANDPAPSKNSSRPMSSLREIHPSWPRKSSIKVHVSEIVETLQLKTLEVYHQTNCVAVMDNDYGFPLEIEQRHTFTGIRELVFWESSFGAEVIHILVSRMPRLEIFRLEQAIKLDMPESSEDSESEISDAGWDTFDAGRTVEALAATVGSQLRGLGLTISFNVGECVTAVRDLREFDKLEDLELSSNTFFSGWLGNTKEQAEREHLRAQLPRLVDILPRSLQRLRIKTANDAVSADRRCHGLASLFQDFATLSFTSLPKLRIVEIVPDEQRIIDKKFTKNTWYDSDLGVGSQESGWKRFPFNHYDPEILAMLVDLDKVNVRSEPGFKFLTFRQGPPSWFEADGHEVVS